jgi:hypothetical protein
MVNRPTLTEIQGLDVGHPRQLRATPTGRKSLLLIPRSAKLASKTSGASFGSPVAEAQRLLRKRSRGIRKPGRDAAPELTRPCE